MHPKRYIFLWVLLILLLTYAGHVQAQLCNGSLGDPVVNITFGKGTNAAVPGYTFINSPCPNDGFYTVTSSTANCFNAWHTVPGDHTGGGGFLLVNASYSPGDFFVETVTDLCANTTYEFAAWMMNVYNRVGGSIKPNITFKIEKPDGTVLQQFETGDINTTSSPEWKQYGFYFTTPATNAQIVLRMTNNAPGGNGNDIALDDITFRPCGPKIAASIVDNSDTVNICEGDAAVFFFEGDVSSAYQSPVYQWQLSMDRGTTWKNIPGATASSYQRTSTLSGAYWYRLAVLEARDQDVIACRISSNVVVINVHAKPIVNVGPDRVMIAGDSILLKATAKGDNLMYAWAPDNNLSNAAILQPTIKPASDVHYTLTAVSEYGCSNEDETFVRVVEDIFIPNAFTPNGDGKNDIWRIPFLDPSFGAETTLFNRYGHVVYHSKAAIVSWDGTIKGKPQASGTYIYIVTIKPGSFQRTGTLTLIR